jgi:hypothetical protein
MKKARSIALNYAFVALIVSVVIALSLWFCEKSLTGQGYEYQFLNFVKIKIPKIGIHFLPFLATLFIFQWVYLKQFFVLNKNEVFRGLQMVGLLGIFLSVMIAILGVQIVIWYFLVLYIFSLAVINLLVAFTSEEAIPPFFVTGFVSVTFLAAVCTFLATLVYSSLGVVEEWIDSSGKRQSLTTRYDVRPDGIFKVFNGQYSPISSTEKYRLIDAVKIYQRKVNTELYASVL